MDAKAHLTGSPTALSTRSGSDRWADIHDELHKKSSDEEQELTPRQEGDCSPEEEEDSEIDDECAESEDFVCEDSAGARLHDSGRCKPCAFFHTKGCKSGVECIFCHRCPPHEKQRRKRMRRQLVQALPFTPSAGKTKVELRDGPWKAKGRVGHSRQNSNASTAATASTGTARPDVQKRGLHSREWSISTQESGRSVIASGAVNPGRPQTCLDDGAQPQAFQNSTSNGFVPPPPTAPAPTGADLDQLGAHGRITHSLAPAQWGQQVTQQMAQQMMQQQQHQQQQQQQQQHQLQLQLLHQQQQQQRLQEFCASSTGSNYVPSDPEWPVQGHPGTITGPNGQQYMLVPVDTQSGHAVPQQVDPSLDGVWYQEPYVQTVPGPVQWQADRCSYPLANEVPCSNWW